MSAPRRTELFTLFDSDGPVWPVFHLSQVGDHVEWDLTIFAGESLVVQQIDGTTTTLA